MFYTNFDKLCTAIGTSPTAFTRDVLGLSTSKVTAWKNGSLPKYEILEQIANVFDVSVGELFDGERYTPKIKITTTQLKDFDNIPDGGNVRAMIIDKVNELDNEKIDRLLGYLEALSED